MLLLLFSLICAHPSQAAQNWNASLSAAVETNSVGVIISGTAQVPNLEFPNARHPEAIYIPSVTVAVEDLEANHPGVMSILKSPRFFDERNSPEIKVSNILVKSENLVQGQVNIKGHVKHVFGTWLILPNRKLEMSFNILLSDFDIAREVLFFEIKNTVRVSVDMDNPYEAH